MPAEDLQGPSEAEEFLPSPASGVPVGPEQETQDLALDETRLEAVGPYKIRRLLGGGAFSSVYLAEQHQPLHRTVAVKVFRWSGGPEAQGLAARFLQEQEVLALLDHPNIARIYDGGLLPDGRPFYVMELVRAAKPLTRFCDDLRLGIQERLTLFLELCLAIQHAHQKGIIHRDLKPANVLAYEEDGSYRVKVIDFGLAKALQRRVGPQTVETTLGAFFGTPAYMPPEQAGADPMRIDTRADIYSLGAILYELLTGFTPLDLSEAAGDLLAQVEWIRHREPIRPSQRVAQAQDASTIAQRRGSTVSALVHSLQGDLDWIVLRCLEKEPGRRYPSVTALVEDIGRYLRHEPVSAAPPSMGYRVRKFVHRHRGILAAVGAVIATLAMGLVGTTLGLLEAKRQAAEALHQQAAAEQAAAEAQRQQALAEAQRQKAESAAQAERLARQDAEAQKQAAQKAHRLAEQRLSHLQKSLEVLGSVLTRLNPRNAETGVLSLGKQLAEAVEWAGDQLEKATLEDPRTISQLQVILGNLLLELGELEKAIQILEKAHTLREQQLGTSHLETLKVRHLLAKAYHTLGEHPKAITLYEKLRDAYQNPHGISEHRTVVLHDLAVAYQDVGRLPQAILLHHRLRQDFLETFGEDSLETLTALNNQALAYLEAGLVSEATALLERVCKLRNEKLGPEHPDTLTAIVSLATAYQEMGRLSEAIELLQKVAAFQQNNLGITHPDSLATLDNLAIGYLVKGNLSEAIRRLIQVREAKIFRFGADQPETLGTLHNLAVAYRELGQLQEALALLIQVYEESVRKNGSEHPDTLLVLYNLSVTYMKLKETEKAIFACEEAALGMEKIGFLHRCACLILQTLIHWYEQRAETSQAEKWRVKWLVSTGELPPFPNEELFPKQLAVWRPRWGLELLGPRNIENLSEQ
ncbi:MAG: serine/threonine-protein kinase [Thermoguttaceae bacterium]|nr:serine/threonine-protein kinase [Thermoguttaceae bacterium]MDW8038249.1 serine/threonine-protein kinase [Thermoguttaceae bacterium]